MTHIQILVTIILSSGVLGGITNFFILYDVNYKSKECWIIFWKSLLLSLCAAIAVPLFLQIISNNLLDQPVKGVDYPDKNYFVLAGFCVLASLYSKNFLENLYDRLKKTEDKVDKTEKKVDQLEDASQEIVITGDIIQDTSRKANSIINKYSIDQYKAVMESILKSKFTYRTITGIMEDENVKRTLTADDVVEILGVLRILGYAQSKKSKRDKDMWRIIRPE